MLRARTKLIQPAHEAIAQSLVGSCIWLATAAWLQPGWSAALLAFAPLVLMPLVLEMLDMPILRRLSLPAFLPMLASYGLEQGPVAGALAAPWLAFALVFVAVRLHAAVRDRRYVLLLVAGNLVVGACWLIMARLGQRPLEYEHAIVHATAVHFHYAGFILPILALQWADAAPSPARRVLLAALLLGVPMVAAGITLSAFAIHWPELIAVWFFVAACVVFAVAQARFALASMTGLPRILLGVSSVSLIVAMSLALAYGTRNYLPVDWLDIPLMLRTHGPIQVFGFALPGVIGWLEHARQQQRGHGITDREGGLE